MDTNINILVVDDFSTMRRIIKQLLKDIGYININETDNGSSALTMLKKSQYDFLVTDWNMPEMTGIELVKQVRSFEATARLPILMVTAEAKKDQIVEATKAGVNGYIVKPFTAETLKGKIEKIFSRQVD